MGVCTTDDQQHRQKISIKQPKEEFKLNESEYSRLYNKQKTENNKYNNNKIIEISLNSKKTIIKTIGQIKGESILIKNNLNCIILIMDYSNSINIQNCQNCSIFLAPCETSINVQDCNNLNLISASLDIMITNVKNSNFYLFVSNSPFIESSENITLGNFFAQYMELPEMFVSSKLNIWDNKWSNYKESGKNIDIKYSNDNIKQSVIDIFIPIFPNCYINIDQFQFVPFVYGKSIKAENYVNFLIILRQEDFQEGEILKMLLPEEIENYRVKLISTLTVKENSDIIKNLIKKLDTNIENKYLINYILRKENEGFDSLKNSQIKNINQNPSVNSINKSRLNEQDLSTNEFANNNFKFLKKKDYLFLWFINEDNDFIDIDEYFNSFFEPLYIGKILKEHFNCDEIAFKKSLEQIFGLEK